MSTNVISWNVAGIRAILKKGNIQSVLANNNYRYDIVLLQETKAEEQQVKLPKEITDIYQYRYWQSTKGTTQRKGLSGTAIWSKTKPICQLPPPTTDEEGRITAIEFETFIVVSVYTPNSQGLNKPRFDFRTQAWHTGFATYIATLNNRKPTIIGGDFNVAHQDMDIHNPQKNRNKVAGFLDLERSQFAEYLNLDFRDAFRHLHPDAQKKYTYWNQLNPKIREANSGWRIDYFLVSPTIQIQECNLLTDERGSDHCAITLCFYL